MGARGRLCRGRANGQNLRARRIRIGASSTPVATPAVDEWLGLVRRLTDQFWRASSTPVATPAVDEWLGLVRRLTDQFWFVHQRPVRSTNPTAGTPVRLPGAHRCRRGAAVPRAHRSRLTRSY